MRRSHQWVGGKWRMVFWKPGEYSVSEKRNQLCQMPVIGQDDRWTYQHGSYLWLWQTCKKKICVMVTESGKTILFNPEWICTTAMLLLAVVLMENMLSNTMNKYLLAIYCGLKCSVEHHGGVQELCLMLHHTMQTEQEAWYWKWKATRMWTVISLGKKGTQPQLSWLWKAIHLGRWWSLKIYFPAFLCTFPSK